MVIDDKTFFILSSNRRSLLAICELFKLTEAEVNHPDCGQWVADCIKQLQTAQLAVRSFQLRQNQNTSIETYNNDPFKEKTNPLLNPEPTQPQNT